MVSDEKWILYTIEEHRKSRIEVKLTISTTPKGCSSFEDDVVYMVGVEGSPHVKVLSGKPDA